uniref:Uncharacterized protein n=1 Tax=Rhizophora mucronata TaxID=61149 RepID=A0A2P2PZD1_RHIMU
MPVKCRRTGALGKNLSSAAVKRGTVK